MQEKFERTKYIEIDRRFMKDNFNRGLVVTIYILVELQLAYIFTKGLSHGTFPDLVGKLGND